MGDARLGYAGDHHYVVSVSNFALGYVPKVFLFHLFVFRVFCDIMVCNRENGNRIKVSICQVKN